MSQKINSISNRLGLVKTWNFESSKYGQNFKNYTKTLLPNNYIFNYINSFCIKQDLLIENINIFQHTSETSIKIFIYSLNKFVETNIMVPKTFNIISNWTSSRVKLSFYQIYYVSNSSLLLSNYLIYLITQKSYSPKKVLLLLSKIYKDQKNKIKYTTLGIKLLELKGLKIEISGCFESSRSQMAKTIKCNFGRIPLTKLNGYVDYSKTTFFTKFGSCGLKIWLFYKFK